MCSGAILMQVGWLGKSSDKRILADVGQQQMAPFARLGCHPGPISAMLARGRTQAACLSQRGRGRGCPAALQEYRSRGCLRAHVSSWVFACWPLWLPASQKKKLSPLWKSRFRPSLPTQASTSKDLRRAGLIRLIGHAAFPLRDQRRLCDGLWDAYRCLLAQVARAAGIRSDHPNRHPKGAGRFTGGWVLPIGEAASQDAKAVPPEQYTC